MDILKLRGGRYLLLDSAPRGYAIELRFLGDDMTLTYRYFLGDRNNEIAGECPVELRGGVLKFCAKVLLEF